MKGIWCSTRVAGCARGIRAHLHLCVPHPAANPTANPTTDAPSNSLAHPTATPPPIPSPTPTADSSADTEPNRYADHVRPDREPDGK